MHTWHKQLLAIILTLSFIGLACNAFTGGVEPTATPVPDSPPTGDVAATETEDVEQEPSPTLTAVPAQTSTPAPVDTIPPTSAGGNGQVHIWPEPAGRPAPFVDTEVTDAQQATFDILSEAHQPDRDNIELAQLYGGFSGEIPVPPLAGAALAVGTIQQLNVLNHEDNTLSPIEVELLMVSDHAYFWFDTGDGSQRPSEAALIDAGVAFDEIYEQVISFFGPEDNPGIDGDPRVHIVNASPLALCNVTIDTAGACGLAGYFSSFDLIPTVVDAESNGREMFVMNVDNFGSSFYLNVLAHEFRHMIEENYDVGDTDWETEGSAMLAEDLLGFRDSPYSRANLFLSNPDQQLNSWTDGFTLPFYGQGYLMNRYIFDRLGPDLYRQFATSAEAGLRAVDTVAASIGGDLTGERVWLDWLVALAIHNEDGIPDIYQIQADGIDSASSQRVNNFPTLFEETVHQNAADYYTINGSGAVTVNFTGSAHVSIMDTVAASGEHMWYANRANYSHSHLTRAFDLTGVSQATLQYSVYHDIEYSYDYAYLFVSTDNGLTYQPLVAEHMQGQFPADNPSGLALADSFYTGRSESWQQETVDLTPYAGQNIMIRFAYLTDPILTFGGFAVDNIAVPEIDFYDDVETQDGQWIAEGFDRVTAVMAQQWYVMVVTQDDGIYNAVERYALVGGESISHPLSLDDSSGEAIVIVAAVAPMTLELGQYQLTIE
jgi:hypothetical protein